MWDINIADQTITFLLSLIIGAVYCILYDIFRIIRLATDFSKVAVFFQDIIYWLICAFTMFCFLIIRCSGEIRGYALAGTFIGWIICRLSFSVMVISVAEHIIRFFRFLKSLILKPILLLFKLFSRLYALAVRLLKKSLTKVKKLLKHIRLMVYTCRSKSIAKKQAKTHDLNKLRNTNKASN